MHSHRTAVLFNRFNRPYYIGHLDVCDILIVTFLLFLPVLNLLLSLKLFVYLHLIIEIILSLCISARLTVLTLLKSRLISHLFSFAYHV